MSFDPSSLRTASPASSGRASPLKRFRPQPGEDGSNPKDKAFRRYSLAVERALGSFDTAQQEWADYISFLSRLLKALQAHPPGSHVVPEGSLVATRLAQCLKPSLPSGVHQKALEVYGYLFTIIGSSNLARDLHLYFPGLSPVLSFASLSVRPLFLSLFEEHIAQLDASALRPALKSVILCLLPGLEDETSEDFDRVLQTLGKFSGTSAAHGTITDERELSGNRESTNSFFWQCFFLATITNPSRRQGALAYLTRYLPKFSTQRASSYEHALQTLPIDAQAALSPEPGLLIRCFASGLSDKQVLVQRGFLDLLVSHLPLDSAVLQHAVPSTDQDRLVFAAVGVVSRRDMSLNRRLWSWFLGPESKVNAESGKVPSEANVVSPSLDASQQHAAYFARHGLRALTRSVIALLEQATSTASDRARPFRICLSLMDRWEVGGLLIPHIFIPAMKNVFDYDRTAIKRDSDEVLKSASNFFDGIESGLIWAKITELANNALLPGNMSSEDRLFNIQLCLFILERFNLREEEMLVYHIPLTTLLILMLLNPQRSGEIEPEIEMQALDSVERLLLMTPQRAFKPEKNSGKQASMGGAMKEGELFECIKNLYQDNQGSIESGVFPIAMDVVAEHILQQAGRLFVRAIISPPRKTGALDLNTKILSSVLKSVPGGGAMLVDVQFLPGLRRALELQSDKSDTTANFSVLHAIATVLATLQASTAATALITSRDLLSFQDTLTRLLWRHLDYAVPKYHVETVRTLWMLECASGAPRTIEASITSLLTTAQPSESSRLDACRRFSVLWVHSIQERPTGGDKGQRSLARRISSHVKAGGNNMPPSETAAILSRPLFVVLDWLERSGSEEAAFVVGWLQQLPSLSKIFEVLVDQLRSLKCMQEVSPSMHARQKARLSQHNDREGCLFYLRHIHRILQAASEHTWIVLASDLVSPLAPSNGNGNDEIVLHSLLIQLCMQILTLADYSAVAHGKADVERVALEAIQLIIEGPFSAPLKELELDTELLSMLNSNLARMDPQLQVSFLNTITSCLKLRTKSNSSTQLPSAERKLTRDRRSSSQSTLLRDAPPKDVLSLPQQPPAGLVESIKLGFASKNSRLVLDEWVIFLRNVLPLLSDSLFQQLMPLVEIFCLQINSSFAKLRSAFLKDGTNVVSPESAIVALLNGLEQILATAHDKLISDESTKATTRSPEQVQGFFGNVSNITSGLFAGEAEKHPTRSATANSRLAVLLCFQDTLRCCFKIWTWGVHGHQHAEQDGSSAASFAYTSLRLRKRALRVLENLFAAEALECLENLANLFCNPLSDEYKPAYVLELLNILNGSRPKYTAPAMFNAIYRRINIDSGRDSVQTSDMTAADLVGFLMEYVKSIEDDAMDEIWTDCVAFLKDILNNPLDYSQILPLLLSFIALIAEKVDNTNFGEQRRMRKELGDIFIRLLTATFTALGPSGFLQDASHVSTAKGRSIANGAVAPLKGQDFALTLASVVSKLPTILGDNERISTATSSVSTNVIGPALRAKAFPRNIDQSFLELLLQVTKVSQGAKTWRKEVTDAFNDVKFFNIPPDLAQKYLVPTLRQLAINDKERLPELLSRIVAPTTAGIMFGVGATSARMEADRKTQLNLRRIALFILAGDEDAFADRNRTIEEKLTELLTATHTSSPSSSTRAEIFMVLRALILRSSPVYLSSFWPIINTEVQNAMLSVLPDSIGADQYTNSAVLQACKILDLLVTLSLDDFQLHEWLFITDTIDAVYRPTNISSTALTDEVAEALGTASLDQGTPFAGPQQQGGATGKRTSFLQPLLEGLEDVEASELKLLPRRDLATRVLQPFFGQLSIWAFEAVYGMLEADRQACEEALLRDIFEDATDV